MGKKEGAAAQEKMRKIREENDRNEKRFRQLSDKVAKWLMQKWQQNFRDCRQEEKEEAAMLRKRWIVAERRWWNSSSLDALCQEFFKKFEAKTPSGQVPGKE